MAESLAALRGVEEERDQRRAALEAIAELLRRGTGQPKAGRAGR